MTDLPERPPLDGFKLHHDMWVCSFGEDGDLAVFGHEPPLRAIAAMNSYSRRSIGLVDMCDGRGSVADVWPDLSWRWGVLQTVDDCPDRQSDLGDFGRHGCEMCERIEAGDWWLRLFREPQPNSIPITLWDV